MNNWKISSKQFMIITILFTIGSAILYTPGLLAGKARQDAWIAGVLGLIGGVILGVLYSKIGNKVKDQDFFHFNQQVFGTIIGNVMSYMLVSYILLICTLILRSMGDFITMQMMVETPIQYIYISFMIVVVIGARYGIETVSRTAEIFLPWIVLLFTLLIIFLFPEAELKNLTPVFENGFTPILQGAFSFLGFPFLELIALVAIYPHVNEKKKARRSFLFGIIYGGMTLIGLTLLSVSVLGVDFTTRHAFPTYVLAKKIGIGEFIQRVEVIVAIIWILTMYFKLTLLFSIAVMGITQMLKLKEHKAITYPLAIIIIVFADVIGPNIIFLNEFSATIWPFHAILIGFFYPLLLLGIYTWKEKRKRRAQNSST